MVVFLRQTFFEVGVFLRQAVTFVRQTVIEWVRRATSVSTCKICVIVLTVVSRHCEDGATAGTRQCDYIVGASEGRELRAGVGLWVQ